MKHHLNIMITALRITMFAASVIAIVNLIVAISLAFFEDASLTKNYFDSDFITKTNHNSLWLSLVFLTLYSSLLLYAVFGLAKFYNCLIKIKKGHLFYHTQGLEFKKAGAAIILFAKFKYVLFCVMGIIAYYDISVLFKRIPELLSVYMIGKLVLLLSHLAEKGEFIKKENELTI